MSKPKVRKVVQGFCNTCNSWRKLTWDHVPPQGGIELTPIELRFFHEHLKEVAKHPVETLGDARPRIQRNLVSQNGLKFKSICAQCNNLLLGARYDLELKRVAAEVGQLVRTRFSLGLLLPGIIKITVQTHLLMRGIIGHLLAAHPSLDRSKPLPECEEGFYSDMRRYFLDESLPLPSDICVYYWPFPGDFQVVITALGLSDYHGERYVVGDLLKFFPLAFYVANEPGGRLPVPYIVGDGCNDLACTVDLHLNFGNVPPVDWPETPTSNHYSIMPMDCTVVTRRRKGKYAEQAPNPGHAGAGYRRPIWTPPSSARGSGGAQVHGFAEGCR